MQTATVTKTVPRINTLRYDLPTSWKRGAGLMRRKYTAPQQHVRKVRREWA